jgi:hypothetical protein
MSNSQLVIGQDSRLYYLTGELFGEGFTVALQAAQQAMSVAGATLGP